MLNPVEKISALGQQVWLDNLSRQILDDGTLSRLIARGVTGITTNPAIFHKAITGSDAYSAALAKLQPAVENKEQRYEALVIADVQAACDLLLPCYNRTEGQAGYVSLEVSPSLSDDSGKTCMEAKRLHAAVGRDNLLIKVPATTAGCEALTRLIADGISVNMTLLFSVAQVDAVAEAYIAGIRQRLAAGGDVRRVYSVASLFLSRVDSCVDTILARENLSGSGQTAVAMAKTAYSRYCLRFHDETFSELARQGARPQYLLWASTSTKNPAYDDLLYVKGLVGAETINTLPDATLQAVFDYGMVDHATLADDFAESLSCLEALAQAGIDLNAIGATLQQQGLIQFSRSFNALLKSI